MILVHVICEIAVKAIGDIGIKYFSEFMSDLSDGGMP